MVTSSATISSRVAWFIVATALACGNETAPEEPVRVAPPTQPAMIFQDLTAFAELEGTTPLGVGAATVVDVDEDGFDDVILPGVAKSIVYRNRGDGTFVPFTEILHPERNMLTLFAAEMTGDGRVDLVGTSVKTLVLFEGRGQGQFVLAKTFPEQPELGFPSVVTFADFELTGKLSLFLARLRPFERDELDTSAGFEGTRCDEAMANGVPPPVEETTVHGEYFRQLEGVLSPLTDEVGLTKPARVQALLAFDVNSDGPIDLFLGTEGGNRDLVYLNDGTGHFQERGLELGFSVTTGAMGMDAADIDGDGDAEIFVSDFLPREAGPLWVRHDDGKYYNEALARGLADTQQYSAWGVGFFDFDLDGDLDLFVVNSAPPGESGLGCEQIPQEPLYFSNDGTGHFTRVSGATGSALDVISLARGAAFSDFDRDGDVDVLVGNAGGQVQLLRNEIGAGHWLQVKLRYPWFEPAVGASVTVTVGGRSMVRWLAGTPSWGGSSSHTLFYGLAGSTSYDSMTVTWPNGLKQVVGGGAADRVVTIEYSQ